ncbi:hypothetical protein [Gracilimonas tropica]|uniref:hypothetical protein n=1 Tax=Gracilimonas tropica TaxID=454600 RepID=UPI0003756783|nr:hypothetical protein [Gracilimonas tropica]
MKNFFFILIFCGISLAANGQSADTYFHSGAQAFINADLQQAIQQVQAGLQQFPNNPKLNALMEKLKEEQQRQQQQQQNQQQQDQQNQQQQDQQEQQQQDQQDKQEEPDQQEKDQQQGKQDQDEKNAEEMNPENMDMQQMSKEEAEKILQALAQKEKELLKEFKKKKTDGSAKHEKDW